MTCIEIKLSCFMNFPFECLRRNDSESIERNGIVNRNKIEQYGYNGVKLQLSRRTTYTWATGNVEKVEKIDFTCETK